MADKTLLELSVITGKKTLGGKLSPNDIGLKILGRYDLMRDRYGVPYEYNGRCWNEVSLDLIESYAMDYDDHTHTSKTRRNEAAAYALVLRQEKDIDWRSGLSPSEIPLRNGVLDVLTDCVREHRQEDWLEAIINLDFNGNAKCPTWDDALLEYFEDDEDGYEKILATQEFFGYCLLPHARYKKALFLYGEPDTGKSAVAISLKNLVGQENACALSTDSLADPRKIAPIRGKMLNLMSDLPRDALLNDGGFKQLVSTGDPIQIDAKYRDAIMYVPHACHVIVTNNLPKINDQTAASFNRMLMVQFNKALPKDKQDPGFEDRLKKELPGILSWSIQGAKRLTEARGQFTIVPSGEDIVEEYRRQQNPVSIFLEEACVHDLEDGKAHIMKREFMDRFRDWHGRQISSHAISRFLRSAGVDVQSTTRGGDRGWMILEWKWDMSA